MVCSSFHFYRWRWWRGLSLSNIFFFFFFFFFFLIVIIHCSDAFIITPNNNLLGSANTRVKQNNRHHSSLLLLHAAATRRNARQQKKREKKATSVRQQNIKNLNQKHQGGEDNNSIIRKKKYTHLPRLIVFDLDGCIWKPELYELARGTRRGQGQEHSPFQTIGDGTVCKSRMGRLVRLIADVPQILDDLVTWMEDEQNNHNITLAISSRTDEPTWATELLGRLTLPRSGKTLDRVMTGPWVILSNENKVKHFERLRESTGVPFSEMVFFDNERGNCKSVSRLGVTVGFSPEGVTREIFHKTMKQYPIKWGVVGLEI